jgi:hypothetical protein
MCGQFVLVTDLTKIMEEFAVEKMASYFQTKRKLMICGFQEKVDCLLHLLFHSILQSPKLRIIGCKVQRPSSGACRASALLMDVSGI